MKYWAKPPSANRWHIFKNNRSLCHKYYTTSKPIEVKENDAVNPVEDCQDCYTKAGLE